MSNITKRKNKDGSLSFYIRAADGYGSDGRQRKRNMKWTAPAGMSEKAAAKEAQRQAVRFEDAVKAGMSTVGGNIRFEEFAKRFIEDHAKQQLKIKTTSEYEKRLVIINKTIGHIKLKDLRAGHLTSFYSSLQAPNANCKTGGKLSPQTIMACHRVVSTVLTKAVKWGYIPFNPATNAELPRQDNKEASFLDEADARRLLELLHGEPIKWRAMVTFDLLSGLRRGELLGLRWQDVDFAAETITIVQASQYVKGYGVFVTTPKNVTSRRPLKLSRSAFLILREYQVWQDEQRELCGSYWKDTDGRIFTTDDGAPIHPDSITKWFREFVKRVNLPSVSVHSLRHTYASLMIADGTPLVVVSKRLGHSQVSTTADIYAHVIQSADEKAAQITERFADVIAAPPPVGEKTHLRRVK